MSESEALLDDLRSAARSFEAAARSAAERRGWEQIEAAVNHVAKLSALFYAQAIAGARPSGPPLTAPTTEFVNIPPDLDGVPGGLAIIEQAASGLTDDELEAAFTSFDGSTVTVRELLRAAAAHYGEHLPELLP